MKVLYITYIDFTNATSGSQVRPQKMWKAFLDAGYEVYLLKGNDSRSGKKVRKKRVRELKRWLKQNRPDFCYIEPTTRPIMYRFDIRLLREIYRREIPMGFFVRDCYYKFSPIKVPGRLGRLKATYYKYLYHRTERILRLMDIVYFPTMDMAELFPAYANKKALPPAGEALVPAKHERSNISIYVGGLASVYYGAKLLLDSFSILNSGDKRYPLVLICRKEEFAALEHPAKTAPWLEVHHVSGKELEPFYKKADLALLPRSRDTYNDITISVKLFEYMSFGLPVVGVKTKATAQIIERHKMGILIDAKAEDFSQAIRRVLDDEQKYNEFRKNAEKAIFAGNLWIDRARQIAMDLTERKEK